MNNNAFGNQSCKFKKLQADMSHMDNVLSKVQQKFGVYVNNNISIVQSTSLKPTEKTERNLYSTS